MESRVKVLGIAVAVALCAALATSPGRGQEEGANATDRDASRMGGVRSDGGDALGGRGVEPARLEDGSASLLRRANRKSLIAATAPNIPAAPSAHIGAITPFKLPGAEGGPARNAIGVAVSGGGQGFGHAVPGTIAPAGIGMRGSGGSAVGPGMATGNVGGADARRSAMPPQVVTSPVAHPSGINGTTMGHVASGSSSIGGPAKDRSGINGTAMRPKH
jgi:hypothetical protein